MQDKELYTHLLGIKSPWSVDRVDLSVKNNRVDVWVDHPEGTRWPCPECGLELSTYDHVDERAWRHLDSCGFHTYLHARVPRVDCPTHHVKQVRVPWSEPSSRFTLHFEAFALNVLLQTDVEGAARILQLSWDEAWHILERGVQRGVARKKPKVVKRISIDEKCVGHGQDYFTLVANADEGVIEFVGEGRKRESLDAYFQGLCEAQLGGIQAVAIDMWDPFLQSVTTHVPDAAQKIVYDRFHVMKHVGEAVNDVRKQEHRALKASGNEALLGTKYLWLYSKENLPQKHHERFKAVQALNLKTGRAWAIKEALRELWDYDVVGWARRYWAWWHGWAVRSRLDPIVKVAAMIKRRLKNILTFIQHRITTSTSEGLNTKIEAIKRQAYGYRNKTNFRTAILFHCGGLDVYPTTH